MEPGQTESESSEPAPQQSETSLEEADRSRGSSTEFPVVGIGASAGGFEAIRQLIGVFPPDTGMALVIIQHLDPTHESLADELLARLTPMPVRQATDGMLVEPNRIYLIPPNWYLSIRDGVLCLTEPTERRGLRMPIDHFFRSLADQQAERAIGIILSGTGSDGTLGIREIKAAGGLVVVQDPKTAQFDGMPQSAIATGMVDVVSSVERMPELLVRYRQHPYLQGETILSDKSAEAPNHLATILEIVRARVKYDFSCYKPGTLARRIQRRMSINHIENIAQYADFLRLNEDEVTALYKDLLINVTTYFREPEAWEELVKQVVAPLVQNYHGQTPIRAWVAGCSTGEEAYTLAMLFTEQSKEADKWCDLQLFASDIDHDALAQARLGNYPENIAADVSATRLRQFFTKSGHSYRINKETREAVVFAQQNVISDPPFSKLDLISCRNLLIYLNADAQRKVLSLFHFALREGGHLFLGSSETLNPQRDLFEPISRKWRIYRRVGSTRADQLQFPVRVGGRTPLPTMMFDSEKGLDRRLNNLAPQWMLQRFAPAAVIIDRQGQVLYLSGPVDRYLKLPSGVPGTDLISMSRDGLQTKLRTALHQALRDDQKTIVPRVRISHGERHISARIVIEPLHQPREAEGLLLVSFHEDDEAKPPHAIETAESGTSEEQVAAVSYEAMIRQVEGDLSSAREELQQTIEELATSNEEFRAANEEVTSINEELQSTNEELETSKEELQSLNEELQTVNSQLEQKVVELESSNNDLLNLFSSTDLATIFLDRQFRLRRFTPATKRLLRVIESDLGRPLEDFARNFTDELLLEDSQQVLQNLTPRERHIQDNEGRWYLRRIVPYRTEADQIMGVVLTFVDITQARNDAASLKQWATHLETRVRDRTDQLELTNTSLQRSEERVRSLLEASEKDRSRLVAIMDGATAAIVVLSPDGLIEHWNPGAERLFGYPASEAVGRNISMLQEPQRADDFARAYQQLCAGRTLEEYETVTLHRDGRRLEVGVAASPVRDDRGQITGVCYMVRGIGERKMLEQQVADTAEQERQRLGRELHDTLSQQVSGIGLLLATLKGQLTEGQPARILEKVETSVDLLKRQLRAVAKGLFPVDVDARGLRIALEELALLVGDTHGVHCRFVSPKEIELHDNFTATQLYMIAREAVINAARHAQADEISLSLEAVDNGIQVSVCDNGQGMTPGAENKDGMGLRIMRHRAGMINGILSIESHAPQGTVVRCHIPRSHRDDQDKS